MALYQASVLKDYRLKFANSSIEDSVIFTIWNSWTSMDCNLLNKEMDCRDAKTFSYRTLYLAVISLAMMGCKYYQLYTALHIHISVISQKNFLIFFSPFNQFTMS